MTRIYPINNRIPTARVFVITANMPLSHQRTISVRFIFINGENGICLFVGKRADITFKLASTESGRIIA